jgi:hypothetical protein
MSLGGTWFILSIYSLSLSPVSSLVCVYILCAYIALYSNRTLVEREEERERGLLGTLTNCCFAEGGPTPGHPSNEAVKIPPARAICECVQYQIYKAV